MTTGNEKREVFRSRLDGVFRNVFDDDTITLSDATTAEDIEGWDSVMHITMIVNVEKEFGMRLSASEMGSLKNVGELLSFCVQRATK